MQLALTIITIIIIVVSNVYLGTNGAEERGQFKGTALGPGLYSVAHSLSDRPLSN